jgi:hypothetical protein
VHDKGIIIAVTPGGFTFYFRDGKLIPDSPPLPGGTRDGLAASHGADITYHTIIPPRSGERLDLHEAIWVCFGHANNSTRNKTRNPDTEFSQGYNPQPEEPAAAAEYDDYDDDPDEYLAGVRLLVR